MDKDRERLINNIWKTRKARINTEKRYIANAEFISNINIYYSILITVISIYLIKYPDDNISLIVVAMSVCLTVSIVFMGTKRYEERAKDLKINYIRLHELYLKALNSEIEITDISEQYSKLLNGCENHSEYDYYKVIISLKEENLTKAQKLDYRFKWIVGIIIKIVIICFPIIILIPFWHIIKNNLFGISLKITYLVLSI